jgi:hypothetical protein
VANSEPVREAIRQATRWIPALDTDRDLRDGAEICEVTAQVPADGYPHGTRFILRRERPCPGAHARVEDSIRTGKDCGFGRLPSRVFAINQAWLELALTGIDLIAWTQESALAPKTRRRPPQPHSTPNPAPTHLATAEDPDQRVVIPSP